jgi:uncharacterized protein (DUF1697 family)
MCFTRTFGATGGGARMSVRVALLRGVNVSGTNRLPMAEFRKLLTGLGLERVETYIQSGNAVFDTGLAAGELAAMIRDGVAGAFGFAPEVFVLEAADITEALHDHPFAGAAAEKVHVFYLSTPPAKLDDAGMRAFAAAGDGWRLSGNRFTLHTPAGIGRSKLAEKLHKFLPGPMTARNLRTIAALQAMIAARA